MHPTTLGGLLVLLVGIASTSSLQEAHGDVADLTDAEVLMSTEAGVGKISVDVDDDIKDEGNVKKGKATHLIGK